MALTEDILRRGKDGWLNEAITCLMFAHAHFPGNSWGKAYVDLLVDLKTKVYTFEYLTQQYTLYRGRDLYIDITALTSE